jgi:ABC-2 type transport system permease protein
VAPAFDAARRSATFAALPRTDADRVALASSIDVSVHIADGSGRDRRAARLYAMAIVGIGLLFLFNGFAFLFTGITGEKQQRITEQMLSMVTPQAWMDGKIIGLAGVAFVGTAFLAGTGALVMQLLPRFTGRAIPGLPPLPADVGALLIVVAAVALGTAMWFAFMAAIAATIDDPNASPRTSLLMLPMLPVAFAFTLVSRADSLVAQVLAMVPLTSMAVLPVRILMTSIPWWEPVVALALLAAAAWWLRRMAGKIFAAGVLLYGKEPTMRETLRWIRETDGR